MVQVDQLLTRQRRTEIQITLADRIQRRIAKLLAMTPIARLRSLLRNKPGRTIPVIGLQQPMDLTSTEVEPFGRLDDAQAWGAARNRDRVAKCVSVLAHQGRKRWGDSRPARHRHVI